MKYAGQEVGRYAHLNPVRVLRLGLDNRTQLAGRRGLAATPCREVVQQRLGRMTLRELSQRTGG